MRPALRNCGPRRSEFFGLRMAALRVCCDLLPKVYHLFLGGSARLFTARLRSVQRSRFTRRHAVTDHSVPRHALHRRRCIDQQQRSLRRRIYHRHFPDAIIIGLHRHYYLLVCKQHPMQLNASRAVTTTTANIV